MKFRKSSWHYWLYENLYIEWCGQSFPKQMNLCNYFWKVLFAVLFLPLMISLAIIVLPFAWISEHIDKKMEFKKKPKKYGLFRQYIKAKKDKICPHIEFVDKEN